MGRYTGPTDKLSRREGINLMLKGARSESGKIEKRMVPPGPHIWRRGRRVSDYGVRLREKQKVKRYYGVRERQFMKIFHQAERQKTDTGAFLLSMLERRLDNVVHKLGLAPSRPSARQLVSHGHVHVNGRRVNIASYSVQVGDRISIKGSERSQKLARTNMEEIGGPRLQNWLEMDMTKLEGQVIAIPTRDDVMIPVEEQLIVEFCSK